MKAITLFRKYSKNFTLVREKYPFPLLDRLGELVACPTCLSVGNESCLDSQSNYPFSVEHLPSEKLGGKPLILTCKMCNNYAGTKLDSVLLHHYKVEPFIAGKENSSVQANIILSETFRAPATVTTKIIKGRKFLEVKSRVNKERLNEYNSIVKNSQGKGFDFAYRRPNPRYVDIAILRIGYLIAFAKLGHVFIDARGHQNIREQIANPEKDILPSFGACPAPLPVDEEGLFVFKFEDGVQCTYACFQVTHENTRELIGVMLPPSGMNDLEFYKQHSKLQQEGELKKFRYVKLDKDDYLHNPNSISVIHRIHHDFKTGKLK